MKPEIHYSPINKDATSQYTCTQVLLYAIGLVFLSIFTFVPFETNAQSGFWDWEMYGELPGDPDWQVCTSQEKATLPSCSSIGVGFGSDGAYCSGSVPKCCGTSLVGNNGATCVASPNCAPPGWSAGTNAFDGWTSQDATAWCNGTYYGACTSGEGGNTPSAKGNTNLCCYTESELGYLRQCGAAPPDPTPIVDGVCGPAAGTTQSSQPTGSAACEQVTFSDTSDTVTEWRWNCVGSGEGVTRSCVALKPAAAPTVSANLTVNGVSSVTVAPGANLNYAWSSTNGIAWSSTWSASGSCADAGSSGTWTADNSGGTASGVVTSSQAGCTYTITYNVTGSSGSASDSITVNVQSVAPPPGGLCQGGIPSGGSAWDSEESDSLTNNTTYWTHSSTDTSTKCQFRCTTGSWNSSTGQCESAPPEPSWAQLSLLKAGSGQGTVVSGDGLINCGPTCSSDNAWYDDGSSVTLTAYEAPGSNFAGWSGSNVYCPGTGSCTVSLLLSKTVTATFNIDTEFLSVTTAGTGTGVVTSAPPGINCGGDCGQSYVANTTVTLTATPDAGSTFDGLDGGWGAGDCDSYTATTCTVSMNANRSVEVTFGGTGLFPDLVPMRPIVDAFSGSLAQGSGIGFLSRTFNRGDVSTDRGFYNCFEGKWGTHSEPWSGFGGGVNLGCATDPALAVDQGGSTDYSDRWNFDNSGPITVMYCSDDFHHVYEGPSTEPGEGENNNCELNYYTVSKHSSAPYVTLTANPSTIAQGAASTLTWYVSNATACTASNDNSYGHWSGSVAFSGTSTAPVDPAITTTYSITCSNTSAYTTTRHATVNVLTPDLTSKNLSLGDGPHYRNNPISITADVENVGPVDAGAFTDRFRYQWNGTAGFWQNFTGNTVSHPSGLAAGVTASDGPVSYTPTSLGTLYIQHCVDSGNTVSEGANTAQNCTITATNITDAPAFACQGSIPDGGQRWDLEEEQSVPGNTFWSYASSDDAIIKCQYRCATGVPIDGQCVSGSITADPISVLEGNTSLLEWTLTNATGLQCRVQGNAGADDWDARSQSSRTSSAINANTTYILSCEGSSIDDVDITVITGPTLRPNRRVVEEGDPVDLIYDTGGQACTLTGGGLNEPVNSLGLGEATYSVSSLEATTTFTLTCPIGEPVSTTVEVIPKGYET